MEEVLMRKWYDGEVRKYRLVLAVPSVAAVMGQ